MTTTEARIDQIADNLATKLADSLAIERTMAGTNVMTQRGKVMGTALAHLSGVAESVLAGSDDQASDLLALAHVLGDVLNFVNDVLDAEVAP